MEQKYCLVKYCRFPSTHITEGHLCPCGQYKHGQVECGNLELIAQLHNLCNSSKIKLPTNLHCDILGCKSKETHTRQSHVCSVCKQREQCSSTCSENFYELKCPMCRTNNKISKQQAKVVGSEIECITCMTNKANMFFPNCGHMIMCNECVNNMLNTNNNTNENINQNQNQDIPPHQNVIDAMNNNLFTIGFSGVGNYDEQIKKAKEIFGKKAGKIFFCSYAGMGCHLFVRRNDINSEIEIFFMHSDLWGQYGHSNVSQLNTFVDGYSLFSNN